jgi:MscS family membrane protein
MTHPRAIGCPRATSILLAATLLFPAVVSAQPFGFGAKPAAAPSPSPSPTPEAVAEASDSPRASARAFLDLTQKADYEAAARYLQVPPGEEGRRAELARRLRAVLERHLDVDLDALSPVSQGSGEDGLPPGVDSAGKVPDGRGGEDPVFFVRARDAAGPFWAFSRQTVSRVDGWYDALPDRWVRSWMPARLQRYGPWGLMWWQWLALLALLAIALALGRVLGAFTTAFLHRLFRRLPPGGTSACWSARRGLTLLWAVAVGAVLLPRLALLPRPTASGARSSAAATSRSSGRSGAPWTSGPSSSWIAPGRRTTPRPAPCSP